jgi:NAD(P)-dependent dehydrogenase (short-subunit alcohol dehydrogenase family)
VIDLSGRVVIVTGGNSGIARGVARAAASVAIWSRRAERNTEAVAELEGLGAAAIGIRCDVSEEDNVVGAASRDGRAGSGGRQLARRGQCRAAGTRAWTGVATGLEAGGLCPACVAGIGRGQRRIAPSRPSCSRRL